MYKSRNIMMNIQLHYCIDICIDHFELGIRNLLVKNILKSLHPVKLTYN